MSKFDDLINDFLNPNKKPLSEETLKKIEDFKKITNEQELDEKILERLGKPNQIHRIIENGMEVIQYIWNTPDGDFMKVIANAPEINSFSNELDKVWENIYNSIKDSANFIMGEYSMKPVTLDSELDTLNKDLETAIDKEDYILAAKVRDKINSLKNEQSK